MGDDFDVGALAESEFREVAVAGDTPFSTLLQNPEKVLGALTLTPEQKKNVKSLIVGCSTGAIHSRLAGLFGDEIGGAVGGALAGFLAKKLIP